MKRVVSLVFCLIFAALLAFGQVGNGTITGTVTDQAGAVLAGATVQAKNVGTGVVYTGVSTGGGNYTITDLPVGGYVITVVSKGFKTYTHTNLEVAAAGTLREDVALQVGANTESVTVTAESSLLKTESAELASNVTIDQMDALPMLGVGTINSGTSGFRNPYNTLLTLPGVSGYSASGQFTLNGLGGGLTETMRTEGQDSTSRLFGTYDYTQMSQPSVDSVQEIAYQTSNYAPEFGSAGSVVINMTMKSGTNQYHGTGYDYFVNEDLNAGDPYTVSGGCETGPTPGVKNCGSGVGGNGGKFRPRARRNDFGGTLGGPIYIPKIYNGHNKSFFFFNYEEFLETDFYGFNDTVPTASYLKGDFSAISPNGTCSLCTQQGITGVGLQALGGTSQVDGNGKNIFTNEIFNPLTRALGANGPYANPFQNNQIPATMFDPTVQKILAFVPAANQPSNLLTGNYVVTQPGKRYSAIPAFKIDHNIDAKDKLSFYYSENTTANQFNPTLGNQDGMPNTITTARGSFITNYQERLNYDRTLTPTLLLHIGAGLYHQSFVDNSPELTFNMTSALGITGNLLNRNFPTTAAGLGPQGTGGLQTIGPGDQNPSYEMRPTGTASVTYVKGKHTFKIGAEWVYEQAYSKPFPLVSITSGAGATQDPFTTSNLGSFNDGFSFASFLLGDMVGTNQGVPTDTRFSTMDWSVYIQDSWKVTRKLTLDYGLRWDYDTPYKEEYGRESNLNATGANLNAGGEPGNYQFAATCGCQFYKSAYPFAIGPRIGVAYQIDPKTVFRAGWGVNYQFISNAAGGSIGTAGAPNVTVLNPSYIPAAYDFINMQTPGVIATPTWPVIGQVINGHPTTSIYPLVGSLGSSFLGTGPTIPDKNEDRPPRINQYSAGFQREITKSFIMEASYVGNHTAWIGGGAGAFLTQLSPTYLAQWGLYPIPGTGPAGYNNEADRLLLTQALSSSGVQQKLASVGRAGYLPYSSFPTSSSLLTSLIAYPQFAAFGGAAPSGAPTGGSKYDSLQMKATKRLSHSLQAGGSFTWGQGFTLAGRQDFWNPQSSVHALQNIPPRILNFNAVYTVPRASFFPKALNQVTKDWQIGFFANYQSASFLAPPTSTVFSNQLGSQDIRVPGQPLYTTGVNPNNQSTYNPYYTQLLNPLAWTPCPSNATCMAGGNLYKDFRGLRTPTENANIARNFRIKERMNFQIRGEFINIFNRTLLPNPSTSAPQTGVTKNNLGIQTGGFGVINAFFAPNTAPAPPTVATNPTFESRQGTVIGRFSF